MRLNTLDRNELTRRYQQHAVAMDGALKEAWDHIGANRQMELSPTDQIEAIDDILQMLGIAHYHVHRLQVYAKLLGYDPAMPARTADRMGPGTQALLESMPTFQRDKH